MKLDRADQDSPALYGKGALAGAVFRLPKGKLERTGTGSLPDEFLTGDGPSEVRVVVYERSEDMLEAMTLEQFEERLKDVMGSLPAGCLLLRVPFDRPAYEAWRAQRSLADGNETRASWAAELEL